MRTAFFSTILDLAERDPRIELITGDLGFGVIEEFAARFPGRLTNVGVAEQNMTGIAAGLALSGSIVFTYSIANFPTLRCLEQLRNDVCYHRANVKVVAVGGGLAYGALGFSHHATEDLAVLRAMPNLMVAAPGDPWETRAITEEIVGNDGPAYVRLGKSGEAPVHSGPVGLPPGHGLQLSDGDDVALIAIGAILSEAAKAAQRLRDLGISTRLISMPWLAPMDHDLVLRSARECGLVATVEEHSIVGGLGGAVAEVMAESASATPLLRIGLPRTFAGVGSQDYLRTSFGIDAAGIADRVVARLQESNELARTVR
jgi:transketolase